MRPSPPPRPRSPARLVSFVIPLFNEEEVFPMLRARLLEVASNLSVPVEFITVNDGSYDGTADLLAEWASQDHRVKFIDLARNFGHQQAMTAGLDYASGDAVLILDGDLQDPPELIHAMLEKYEAGYDVVRARRKVRRGERWTKRFTAAAFYWVLRRLVSDRMTINEGDFCLLSRSAVRALGALREGHRFTRGLVGWIGLPSTSVDFERMERKAGETKFPLRKMLSFAGDAIFSFSVVPLRLSILFGAVTFTFGLLIGIWAVYLALRGDSVRGWSSLIVLQSMIGGSTLFCIGVAGEYIGRCYEELKGRPLYIVREALNVAIDRVSERTVLLSSPRSEPPAPVRVRLG